MTSYFEIQGCPNRKQKKRKHLRGNGEIAKEKQDWKKTKGKWSEGSSLRELKTVRLVLTDKF